MNKILRNTLLTVIIPVIIFFLFMMYINLITPSYADAVRCGHLVYPLLKEYRFPFSVDVKPGKPAVFCDPGRKNILYFFDSDDVITIYYVTDKDEQLKIVEKLKGIAERVKTDGIRIDFYKEENWIFTTLENHSGRSGHKLEEEKVASYKIH